MTTSAAPECTKQECAKKVHARGLCVTHYSRQWKETAGQRAHIGQCHVCESGGVDKVAAMMGLCTRHYTLVTRARSEAGGYRAPSPSCRGTVCVVPGCGKDREQGSYFCGETCRTHCIAWARKVTRNCVMCTKEFTARSDGRYCSNSCRAMVQHVKKKFGLTAEEYVARVRAPHVRCAICKRSKEEAGRWLVLDHDHATGRLRGTLCHECNRGLGNVEDDPTRLGRLGEYLQAPPPDVEQFRVVVKQVTQCRLCDAPTTGRWHYCSLQCRDRRLSISKYGLTAEMYRGLNRLQGGRCPGCEEELENPNVEHCHASGVVRGLTCGGCNLAICALQDSVELMAAAAAYLRGFQT